MKKIIMILVCLIMVLNCSVGLATGWGAITDDVRSCGDYSYRVLEDGTAEIVRWSGTDAELTIAAELDGYKVSSIGDFAFDDCSNLVSVTVPYGIIRMGINAFSFCGQLKSIALPESLQEIGYNAFLCCDLETISIPDSITVMKEGVFYGNMDLREIVVSPDHQVLEIINGALVDKTRQSLICLPSTLEIGHFTVPEGIKRIGSFAFGYCTQLVSVDIPDTVTEIGSNAFIDCSSLSAITIPDSVLSVDSLIFQNCEKLTEVMVSPSHPTLSTVDGVLLDKKGETLLFCPMGYDCNKCTIPEGVSCIAHGAFFYCEKIESIVIPEGVTTIYGSFNNCSNLVSITIPDSLVYVKDNPFSGCKRLINVEISPDHPTLEIVDEILFDKKDKQLICCLPSFTSKNYSIPQGTTVIQSQAFLLNGMLEKVNIPETVESIGMHAFYHCSSLQSVIISSGVTSIEMNAFEYCDKLSNVTIPASVETIGIGAFGGCPNLTLTVVPGSAGETYAISENIPYVYGN